MILSKLLNLSQVQFHHLSSEGENNDISLTALLGELHTIRRAIVLYKIIRYFQYHISTRNSVCRQLLSFSFLANGEAGTP